MKAKFIQLARIKTMVKLSQTIGFAFFSLPEMWCHISQSDRDYIRVAKFQEGDIINFKIVERNSSGTHIIIDRKESNKERNTGSRNLKLLNHHKTWSKDVVKNITDINNTLNDALEFIMEKGLYEEFKNFSHKKIEKALIQAFDKNEGKIPPFTFKINKNKS